MKRFPAKRLLSFVMVAGASVAPVYAGNDFLGLSAGDIGIWQDFRRQA